MKKILIIEDDGYIRNSINKILKMKQFETRTARTVLEAEQLLKAGEFYDLYLLDVILPDGSGFDICKKIRAACKAPIIFLTACDDEESITTGLDIGGDDYIVKPFRAGELLSRIQANLRRMQMNQAQGAERKCFLGGLEVDFPAHRVSLNGQPVSLTPTEFELLRILIDNSGQLIKRGMLLEKLWDSAGNFVEDNTLTVAVSRLKSKLASSCKEGAYIETIRGVGYRWIGKAMEELND